MTAFYTMRQISLTFGGEPRSEAAAHANLGQGIVSFTMTLPLVILAVFAIGAGFVGVPTDFPILGPIFSPEYNAFHHLVIEALPLPETTAAFASLPDYHPQRAAVQHRPGRDLIHRRAAGLVARLYGLLAQAAQSRPSRIRWKTSSVRCIPILQNRYYLDDVYIAVFVKPSQWLARQVTSLPRSRHYRRHTCISSRGYSPGSAI